MAWSRRALLGVFAASPLIASVPGAPKALPTPFPKVAPQEEGPRVRYQHVEYALSYLITREDMAAPRFKVSGIDAHGRPITEYV